MARPDAVECDLDMACNALMDEPVCFVQDPHGDYGRNDSDIVKITNDLYMLERYRRLERGWTDAAVVRIQALMHRVAYNGPWTDERTRASTSEAIRAALFPPSEPTAEQVIGECVVALEALRGTALDAKEIGPDLKAQIVRATEACRAFAKARRAREEQR